MSRTATVAVGAPERLPWSGDDEADRLIAADPNALLIGFVLDQQVTVQKAFSGPLVIRQRLGSLDPKRLAALDPQRMRDAFAKPPAVHRFPAAMADRIRALCGIIATEVPDYPTLGDVSTADELAEYQAQKRAWKAQLRSQGIDPGKHTMAKPGKEAS